MIARGRSRYGAIVGIASLLGATVLGFISFTGPAQAFAGSCQFQNPQTEPPGGPLAIERVSHNDTSTRVTYTITTDEPFEDDDVEEIRWLIDVENASASAQLIVTPVAGTTPTVWSTSFVDENDNDVQEAEPISVTRTDNTDTFTVSFDLEGLEAIGLDEGDAYTYRVRTLDNAGPAFDVAECEHTLGPAPTPTPTPTPTPAPPADTTGPVNLDETTLPPGGTLRGSAPGFATGTEAMVFVFSEPRHLANVPVVGVATFAVQLPLDLALGQHTVEVRGVNPAGGVHIARGTFTIAAAATPTPTPGLPKTGDAIAVQAGLGSGLTLLGFAFLGMVAVYHKRKNALVAAGHQIQGPIYANLMTVFAPPVRHNPPPGQRRD